jgi:hypothetical protein
MGCRRESFAERRSEMTNIAEARRMSVSCADPCHGFQLQPFFRDVNLLFEAKEVYLACISHFFSVPVVPSLRKF